MTNETELTDLTSIASELIVINARIKTLTKVLLTDAQRKAFQKELSKALDEEALLVLDKFPGIIKDISALKEYLSNVEEE